MNFNRPARPEAEISLTPLIDILFTVLLFLVVTATYADYTVLQVNLPSAATGVEADASRVLRIGIEADGTVLLDGTATTTDTLDRRLQATIDKEDAVILLAADAAASHGRVIEIVDLVRRAGIFRVHFETTFAATGAAP